MAGIGKAFQQFGARGRNPRWSWSARTPDDGTVVLALWDDLFDWKASPVSYTEWDRANTQRWFRLPGNRERIENLRWARDHCGGRFRVVVVYAMDEHAHPRRIRKCLAREDLVMGLIEMREHTGEFRAVEVRT